MGPHAEDIFACIEQINEINKTAGIELSKLSLKIMKTVKIREAHLKENRYAGVNKQEGAKIVESFGFNERDEIIKRVISQNVQPDVLPQNGEWENPDKPGEGMFIIDDYVQIVTSKGGKKESISGAELKKKYNIKGVYYHNNEPDFSPFVDKKIGIVKLDEIPPVREGKGGTFDIAVTAVCKKTGMSLKELQQYMTENRLTWHETADRKHIMPIPTEINTAYKHTGGISKEESLEAIRDVWNEKFGGHGIVVQGGKSFKLSKPIVAAPIKAYGDRKKTNKKKKYKDLQEERHSTPKITNIVFKR